MKNNTELKPCPFCGSKVYTETRTFPAGYGLTSTISYILCDKCGACVSFRGKEPKKQTEEAWNERAGNGKGI